MIILRRNASNCVPVILSRVLVSINGVGLVIGLIDCLQVATTSNYNIIADFHATNHSLLAYFH
jgi:hypothetical protein